MAQLCTHYDSGAKLFAHLDDWFLWIKPQYLLQTIAAITTATRSVNLALQTTKTQIWKGSCQDPIPPEYQHKVTLTLSCLGGHLQIHGDTEPSPVVLGEQATMEKTTQRFQKIATTLSPYASRYHLSVVFSTPQAWWTWGGLCSSTSCGRPMARVAVDHSHAGGNNPITGHRFPLQFNTTTTSSACPTPNHPFPTNE